MGSILPKPVESAEVERHVGKAFRVGVAEVNGWRNGMEDANLIHMCPEWAFFGVFDGHGGDQCSAYVVQQIEASLKKNGCPKDDAALKKMVLAADKAFLDSKQDSGSTGTMCIVQRPSQGNKFSLRIANVGDSRVLLGRRDGAIVDGGGTDSGLTTDHKPDHPSERERIYRCGGYVEVTQEGGPARVNGELSVSRCFGDASHKTTGGPKPEDHPVTADPEMGHSECSESDFLLLVCDGISEGDFPNAEVVKMVAASLKEHNDPGAAGLAVCHKAIEAGSKDNVTCMVVLLTGSGLDKIDVKKEFIPGPLSTETLKHKGFVTAYEGMAKRASMTLAQAAEMRYETVAGMLARNGIPPAQAMELRAEVSAIGAPGGTKGSSARSAWFRKWEERLPDNMTNDDDEQSMIRSLMAQRAAAAGGAGLNAGPRRRVRLPDVKALQRAVTESDALDWDARMADVANAEGEVMQDDPSDNTSQVFFRANNVTAWLPTSALIRCDEPGGKFQPRGGGGAAAGVRRGQLPPTPPRMDANIPGAADSTLGASGRRVLPRPDAAGPAAGGRGLSPGSFRLNGNAVCAPRLPSLSGTGGIGGRTTPPANGASPSGAGKYRQPSPVDAASGNRHPRASSEKVGGRTPQAGYRQDSPSSTLRCRPQMGAAGRLSRSTPPLR